jgi:hypothetical protein
MNLDDANSAFAGFGMRDQELKYNLTLFDLVMTLAARVGASLQLSKTHLTLNVFYE